MNRWWLVVAGVGLVVLWVSITHARKPFINAVESRVFHTVNGLPDCLYSALWLPMPLANLVVGTGAALIVALVDRDLTVAIGVTLAMVLKLLAKRVVRVSITLGLEVDQVPRLPLLQ
jgi:hypothetical protein